MNTYTCYPTTSPYTHRYFDMAWIASKEAHADNNNQDGCKIEWCFR